MKEIELTELKNIQLKIVKVIHEYCQIAKINYSLGYGSLLGAIRHGGFIPWDDDIDIVMPRVDYERFICEFNYFDKRYQVRNHNNFDSYPFPFAKVEDTMTIKDELGYNEIGIAIDIFPIDNIPDREKEARCLFRKCRQLILLNQIKFINWDSNRPFYKNMFAYLLKIPLSLVSFKRLTIIHEKISVKHNSSHTNSAGCLIAFYKQKEIMPSYVFSEYTSVPFENLNLMIIKNYDKYLTNLYGDYMQLPPENKRKTHHAFKVFWK